MKAEAEQKFNKLIKEIVDSEDFQDDLDKEIEGLGYDKPPDFETFKRMAVAREREFKREKRSRRLKIASFVIAVFTVAGTMNFVGNSNVAIASMFEINNLMFSIRNGFVATDFQFNSTSSGRELIIEKEEQISIGKDFLRELKVPGYIPDGYGFISLRITNNPQNEFRAFFIYESDKGSVIAIRQENISYHNIMRNISGVEKDFFIDDTRIFYSPCIITGASTMVAFTPVDLIQITGVLDLDELLNIFEHFR